MNTSIRLCGHLAILLAFLVVGGCVYVPLFGGQTSGVDFRPLLGERQSTAPIRPGATSAVQVNALLVSPWWTEESGQVAAFRYATAKGEFIAPLGHFGWTEWQARFLFVRFDTNGILSEYEVLTEPWFENDHDFRPEFQKFIAKTRPREAR